VISKRHVTAAVIGNALEFYDFTTYAFFAAQIGRAFFPSQNPLNGLEASLAIFGAGFFTRPLGALVIGSIGDRVGRRPAMLLSFALMGVAILGLALCPSYAQIGPAAPVLVILIRLVQGFALGGEVGPTTAFLLEAAPPHRRAVYTGLQSVSQNIASLTAGVVGFTLASLLTTSQIDLFGWRIAFLIGAIVLPFGLIIRRSLPETLHHVEPQPHAKTGAAPTQLRVILCSIAILAGGTVATYIQGYLTTYCGSILHMKLTAAFSATIVYGATGIVASVSGALLADRFGRRPVMVAPRVLLFIIILPAFWLLNRNRDAGTLALITLLTTACASTSGGAIMVAITESLRKSSRSTTLAIVYASAIAVFGGTTQWAVTKLIDVTGDILSPAYFYMVATAVGIAGMVLIKESAPHRQARLVEA
jgi:MFS family permease